MLTMYFTPWSQKVGDSRTLCLWSYCVSNQRRLLSTNFPVWISAKDVVSLCHQDKILSWWHEEAWCISCHQRQCSAIHSSLLHFFQAHSKIHCQGTLSFCTLALQQLAIDQSFHQTCVQDRALSQPQHISLSLQIDDWQLAMVLRRCTQNPPQHEVETPLPFCDCCNSKTISCQARHSACHCSSFPFCRDGLVPRKPLKHSFLQSTEAVPRWPFLCLCLPWTILQLIH